MNISTSVIQSHGFGEDKKVQAKYLMNASGVIVCRREEDMWMLSRTTQCRRITFLLICTTRMKHADT